MSVIYLKAPIFEGSSAAWPAPTEKKKTYRLLNADVDYLRRTHFQVSEATFAREAMRLAKNADRSVPSGPVCSARLP